MGSFTLHGAVHLDRAGREVARSSATTGKPRLELRDLVADAFACDAAAVIVLHRTLTDNFDPALLDQNALTTISRTLNPIGIRVHDHVICDRHTCIGLRAEGLF